MELSVTEWVSVGLSVGALIFTMLVWRLRGEFATRKDAEDIEKRLESVEQSVTTLSTQMKNAPSHADLADLKKEIGTVQTQLASVTSQVSGVHDLLQRAERQLEMLLQHHMKGDK